MGEVRAAKLRPVNERNRAIDLAERPRGVRQVDHRGDAGVQSEAESQIVVAAGLEQGQRALQVIPSLAILAGERRQSDFRVIVSDAPGDKNAGRPQSRTMAAAIERLPRIEV